MRKHLRLNCSPEQLSYIQDQLSVEERLAVLMAAANAKQRHRQEHPDPLEALLTMGQEPPEPYEEGVA